MADTRKSTFICQIRDKKTGKFLDKNSFFTTKGRKYKSEAAAKLALSKYIGTEIYRKRFKRGTTVTKEMIKEIVPNDYEVIVTEFIQQPDITKDLSNHIDNILITQKLAESSYGLRDFWVHAMNKGYADQIVHVVELNKTTGTTRSETAKYARDQMRLIGVKSNEYFWSLGVLGFVNRDQAFKARLTLDARVFIDVDEIRKTVL